MKLMDDDERLRNTGDTSTLVLDTEYGVSEGDLYDERVCLPRSIESEVNSEFVENIEESTKNVSKLN